MYTLKEKMRAVELVRAGMTYRRAAEVCGISRTTIWKWHRAVVDNGGDARALAGRGPDGKEPDVDLDRLPDDPEELKRIVRDLQFELDLKDEMVKLLKKDLGVDPRALPNREKALLVDALAERGTYSVGWMLSCVGLAPATFYYHRGRLGLDPEGGLREAVRGICAANPAWGYRRVKRALETGGWAAVSEKRVRRIMGEEGLQPPRRRKSSRYSSYSAAADTSDLPNVPLLEDGTHDFSAPAPNVLWVTDVTEFLLPCGARVYLSPVLDCFDGALASWRASVSERAEDLTNPSLEDACASLREGDAPVIHSDRGGQYHSAGWVRTCGEHGLRRSMSRKGHSPDNARMEGFFGRLKMEFFDTRDWRGVGAAEFIAELDSWLVYYNERRAKEGLGWMSPLEYRRSLGLAA